MEILKQFHYQILGKESIDRVPLVFLHGLMGYGLNWKRIANAFQYRTQVLIFDQRGHGKSYHPPQGYAPEDYADDLALILDELSWDRIDLVGHSMGGRNAMNFGYRFSSRIRRLVIEDIGPVVAEGSAERIQALIDLVPVPFKSKLEAKEFFMNIYPKLISSNPHAQTLGQYFYSNMEELSTSESGDSSSIEVNWRFNKEAIIKSLIEGRSKDRWQEWEQLSMPILLVRGERSEDLSRSLFDEMLKRNSLSRGVEIKKAGHWVHFDQPEQFIQALKLFLESTEAEIFSENFDFLLSSS